MPAALESEADYRAALQKIRALWTAEVGTPAAAEFDRWARLVEHYESVHYPIRPATAAEIAAFRRDQMGGRS